MGNRMSEANVFTEAVNGQQTYREAKASTKNVHTEVESKPVAFKRVSLSSS